jgi:heptaprenylglyceryl phosphate synthase
MKKTAFNFSLNKVFALAIAASFAPAYAGESCQDNFVVTGNMLTGNTFITTAVVRNVSPIDAFDEVSKFTASTGWTILNADKTAGIIEAVQSSPFHKNRLQLPFTIKMETDGGDTIINMSYSTTFGAPVPENAIKAQFCNTAAAAAKAAAAPVETEQPPPPCSNCF